MSATGITERHGATCGSRDGLQCSCKPKYQASAYDRVTGKKLRRTFDSKKAAESWRRETQVAIDRGVRRGPSGMTVKEAGEEWFRLAEGGNVLNRSGDRYKPSAIRGYREAFDNRIVPELGNRKLDRVTLHDVQDLVDSMRGSGLAPATIRNVVMPLRVIYKRAIRRGLVAHSPVAGVELQSVRSRLGRIAAPDEAQRLVGALPRADRAIWATAMYAGLRLGELQALRWRDVDLAGGMIHVTASYDRKEHAFIAPKSRAGMRRVPVASLLRDHLDAHKAVGDAEPEHLVFGRGPDTPFCDGAVRKRAVSAWTAAGLVPIGYRECRHSFASVMIAAGVNAKALSTYMGHANISITFDIYGHLMPGSEAEAAGLLDAYMERANTSARLAQLAA